MPDYLLRRSVPNRYDIFPKGTKIKVDKDIYEQINSDMDNPIWELMDPLLKNYRTQWSPVIKKGE